MDENQLKSEKYEYIFIIVFLIVCFAGCGTCNAIKTQYLEQDDSGKIETLDTNENRKRKSNH